MNNNNDSDKIVFTPEMVERIPYFKAMRSFHAMSPNANIILYRNTSGFNDETFNVLKEISETGSTRHYKIGKFLKNYLQVPNNINILYTPTLPAQETVPRKPKIYTVKPTVKEVYNNSNNYYNYGYESDSDSDSDYILTEKQLRKNRLRESRHTSEKENAENTEAHVEQLFGPGSRPDVINITKKAKTIVKRPNTSKKSKQFRKTHKKIKERSKHIRERSKEKDIKIKERRTRRNKPRPNYEINENEYNNNSNYN
jgi:hypothetical protein